MTKMGIIIQARLDSTRLCHKVLREIGNKTVLEWVIEAALAVDVNHTTIVTTPDRGISRLVLSCDGWYDDRCESHIWPHPRDPLAEYRSVAVQRNLDTIVRLTADCPMIQAEHIDDAIDEYERLGCDLYYNGIDGADVEVFSRQALETAFSRAKDPEDREHVTLFMARHMTYVSAEVDEEIRKKFKSLDTQEDLDYIRSVMGQG